MKFTARQLADLLDGTVEGNPDTEVSDICRIEEGKQGAVSFLANPKYTKFLYDTKASAVIINKDFELENSVDTTLIKVEDAYQSLAKILAHYESTLKVERSGREEPHYIAKSAKVGANSYIGAFAYIGENVEIGENVKIYPQVYIGDNVKIGDGSVLYQGTKVYHHCKIGQNCTIHATVVIGGDGFGFAPQSSDIYQKVPQVGDVIIEDNVEIGSGTTIDRATIGSTIIRKGVKLDNLIQIAHNVEIGENTVIAAQSGVAGSTKIGKNCMFGGQVGVVGHLKIGDNVKVAAQSGIGNDVKDGEIVQGSPAYNVGQYKRSYVYFKKLPELGQRISQLEKELEALKQQNI